MVLSTFSGANYPGRAWYTAGETDRNTVNFRDLQRDESR